MKNGSKVQVLNIEDVYANPQHYREVKPENVKKIADSIEVAGQLVPIDVVKDGEIYFVLSGHHRLAAMKQLGDKTIQAIVQDFDAMDQAISMIGTNLSIPESDVEKSRGIQMMFPTGVTPQMAAAVTGESVERVEKAQRGLKSAGEAAEDMTLERLIAVAEVEDMGGDAAAVIAASEKDWWQAANKAKNLITNAEKYKRYLEIAKASGVEMIEAADFTIMVYESSGEVAPEGAAFVRVIAPSDDGGFSRLPGISWYKAKASAADLTPDEAEHKAKELEDQEMKRLALESATKRRDEWLRDYVAGKHLHAGADHLAAFIDSYWEDGNSADVSRLYDDFAEGRPFVVRVRASLIREVASTVEDTLRNVSDGKTECWQVEEYGGDTIKYMSALRAMGYDPTPLESDLIAKLEWSRLEKEDDE